jgi:hypothetical protein
MKPLFLGLFFAAASFAQLTITTISLPPATINVSYSATIQVSGGVPPYTVFVADILPPGLGLTATGILSGIPSAVGTSTFQVRAVDAQSNSTSRFLTLVVNPSTGGTRPVITTSSPLPVATIAQPYQTTLAASGGVAPYKWAVSGTLPAGLQLNTTTGVISGTPTVSGTFSLAFQVSDSAQPVGTGSATLSLTISPAPLTITTVPPLFSGTVGTGYAQTFAATGGQAPYNWSIISGSTGGLTLDAATGVLSGTPQTAGSFDFVIQVADNAGTRKTASFTVLVNPPALTITVGVLPPSGTVGVPYSQKLSLVANGGTPPVTWSVASGSVPGLSFDPSSLVLSGTPTTAGTFSLTIQAADSAGLTARRAISLTIAPAALSITTGRAFPDVLLNSSFQQTLTATGGTPPYTWSASGLPAGLTLNASQGVISGTVTQAGNFGIAITVTDSALAQSQDRFTLNVLLPPTPAFTLSGLPATISAAQQIPLSLSVASSFPAPITGQVSLIFSPDSGLTDRTVVFASGSTSVNFTVPAGSTTIQPDSPLVIQTGTVAGTVTVSVRLQSGGVDITPSPAPAMVGRLENAAPVISDAKFTRSGSTISVAITGYATSREVTQAVFTFTAASGQTLQSSASSITVDVGSVFNTWYQSANNTQYGSQFVFTQPFTIQGDATAVTPTSVTLTNRQGSTKFAITP